MADKSYDAVVIGGGHHGLIIACYLQQAGMKTAVFELQSRLGGGVTSIEGPLPGFTMNPCANWTRFYSHPAYKDFNLREKGLEYTFPEGNEAMIFDNDTCLVGYSALKVINPSTGETEVSHENLQKTLNEIRRFSQRDADTAEELFRRYINKWKSAMAKYRFSPPVPWGKKNELEKLCDDTNDGFDPIWQFMTTQQLAYDLFESEELRTLFIRAAMTSFGGAPDDVVGLHGLVHSLGMVLSWEPAAIAKGGSQSVTNALQKAFTEMGGEFLVHSKVVKVLVENEKAKGICLEDGTEIEAKNLVVSSLSALQTIQLIGEENLDSKIVRRVRNIRYNRHNIIWAVFAVHELPLYKAASFNPDCGQAPRTYLGPRNADYVANQYLSEIFLSGISSKLCMFLGVDTIWDGSRAPEGKHIIGIEEFSAPVRFFSTNRWQELRNKFEAAIIKQWQIYAPNMTRDNIIACRIFTPYDIQLLHPNMHEGSIACGDVIVSQMDRFRPIPELSNYRTPIKNIYLCSSASHNGVGTGRGCSYNCWQVICEDLGV
ncbi:MAG: NAD(P)/FAD-dependent oxidoreductase [Dethiobacter sp.]|jgi:phytoene dehydrogenase-like protein|nr:MAG: NAD(P)/FAD-dependent oxidoreductase [Dethiobacter sp.]